MKSNEHAFPVFDSDRAGTDYGCHERGMTLRDYFAGQALSGIIGVNGVDWMNKTSKQVAENAYKFADAMLAEREK